MASSGDREVTDATGDAAEHATGDAGGDAADHAAGEAGRDAVTVLPEHVLVALGAVLALDADRARRIRDVTPSRVRPRPQDGPSADYR